MNLGSRGQLTNFVAPAFCSATLTALNKKKTGIRPIAVGEVIRRLVAKCIAKEAAIEAVDLFGSKQLGVAVKGGAESIVHATKITFERMKSVKSGGILQIDFRNAFNSVKRSHLLGSTKVLLPSIISFASFCYSKHSDLFFNSSIVDSQTGVQQGDQLGPLLFSLAIWPLIDEIESKIPNLLKHCWYLDDGIIAGTEIELCEGLEILSESGEKFGLERRKDKCELWSFESMTKIDSLIKRNCVDRIEILGAAIGSDAFVSSCLLKRVKKLEELLDNLAYVDDPQCALSILRFCLGALVVYSLRCNSPSNESNKIIRKFDSVQRATFEGILGVLLSDTSWDQACLPINKTGVGIRRSADQVQAAYVGSVFQSSVLLEKLTGHNPTEDISFVKAVEELSEIATTYPSQRKSQEELDNSAFDNLLGKQSCSIREKARLQSLSQPKSGAWLSAAPVPALGLHLSSNEFRVALKYRLGVKVYENERKCPFCKSGTLDVMGDHAVSCHGRGDMISRHDRIRDKIISACSGALLSHISEQKSLLPDNNSRPGDIFLPVWNNGLPAALDVTVTSPLQSSLIINASEKSGFALSAAEDRKYEQYAQNCSEVGIQFIPLAFETFAGFSETVRKTLKRIATLADNRNLQPAGLSVAFSRLSQSVSVTAIRGSAIMLLARDARL